MRKRVFSLLFLVLSILVLTACRNKTETTFKLTLPTEVTANVNDLNNISENTDITLTVNVPANKNVETFKINGESVTLTNNTYVFKINKDTTVSVTFKDIDPEVTYFKLTLPAEVTTPLSNLNEIEAGKEIVLTVNVPANKLVESFKVNNEEKTLTNNKFTFNITKNTLVTVSFIDVEEPVVTYFTLTLPAEVTANVSNKNEVEENSEVVLTLAVPQGKTLDKLFVNGDSVNLVNNKYTFNITKNTTVTVTYLTGWQEVDPLQAATLLNNLDVSIFHEGTLKIINNKKFFTIEEKMEAYLKIDEHLNLLEAFIVTKHYGSDVLVGMSTVYLDGSFMYEIYDSLDGEGNIVTSKENVMYFDSSMQGLEIFGVFLTDNPVFPSGFNSFNELVNFFFETSKEEMLMGELFDEVKYFQDGNLFKLDISSEDIELFDMFGKSLEEENDSLVILFESNKLNELTFISGTSSLLDFKYGDFDFDVDPRILAIDNSTVGYLTYNYHLGDDEVVTVSIDDNFANDLKGASMLEIINFIKPYQPNKKIVGLYLDEDFTQSFKPNDFLTDQLDIYVKWEDILEAEELISLYTQDDKMFLKSVGDSHIYYEDENYIYQLRYNNEVSILDKNANKLYEVLILGEDEFQSFYFDYHDNKPFLLDSLLSYENKDFILLKSTHVKTGGGLMFFGDLLNVEPDSFAVIDSNLYEVNEDEFDLSVISLYIAAAEKAEIVYIVSMTEDFFVDVENLSEEVSFYFIYSSGGFQILSFDEAIALGLTYTIENSLMSITFEDIELEFDGFKLYDSKRGLAVIFDYEWLYYLDEMTELPEAGDDAYYKITHFETEKGDVINTLADLVNFETNKKFIHLFSQIVKIDAEEVLTKLKDASTLTFERLPYEVTYSVDERMFELEYQGDFLVIKITEDFYYFTSEDAYFKVPTEHFDFGEFFFKNWHQFPYFYFGGEEFFQTLIMLDEALNSELSAEETYYGYLYSNGLELFVEFEGISFSVDGTGYLLKTSQESVTLNLIDDQTYYVEIINNIVDPIIFKFNDIYQFPSFSYSFKGYVLVGTYYVDSNQEPLFEQEFQFPNEEEHIIYSLYTELYDLSVYLEPIIENDKFILEGDMYTIKVNKNSYYEIYLEEELKYLYEFATNKLYVHQDDILYEAFNVNKVLNIVDFVNFAEEHMFYYDSYSGYNFQSSHYDNSLYFVINAAKDLFIIADKALDQDNYKLVVEDFESIDISGFVIEQEEIVNITVYTYFDEVMSINSLDYLFITLEFEVSNLEDQTYLELVEIYNGSYDNNHLYFTYFDQEMEIDLADHGISVYDESIDQVVVFYDLNMFSYLSDLTELPVITDGYYDFVGWLTFDGQGPVTLEDIQNEQDDVIYLYPQYDW